MTLIRKRVSGVEDPLFKASMAIYRSSFPVYEQRELRDFPVAFAFEGFNYEAFTDESGSSVAILVTWRRADFVYLEYFAVRQDLRGQGVGSIILDGLSAEVSQPIILEIDPPEDEVSIQRLGFYQRHGYVPNPQFDYIHPPYTEQGKSFPLLVMSYGKPLNEELYRAFEHFHHTRVVRR